VPPHLPAPDPPRALDHANAAIRAWVRGLPPYAQWTPGQKAHYDVLLDEYNAARERLREASEREAEEEPAPVAA
jgi:hypothetical protein